MFAVKPPTSPTEQRLPSLIDKPSPVPGPGGGVLGKWVLTMDGAS